jgi:hypothetical protein
LLLLQHHLQRGGCRIVRCQLPRQRLFTRTYCRRRHAPLQQGNVPQQVLFVARQVFDALALAGVKRFGLFDGRLVLLALLAPLGGLGAGAGGFFVVVVAVVIFVVPKRRRIDG